MKLLTKDNLENMIDAGCIDEVDMNQILKWKTDAEKYEKGLLEILKSNQNKVIQKLETRIKEIRYQLDHTNPDYKRSIALQEALQEMVNLIGFEKYEEIMVGKK